MARPTLIRPDARTRQGRLLRSVLTQEEWASQEDGWLWVRANSGAKYWIGLHSYEGNSQVMYQNICNWSKRRGYSIILEVDFPPNFTLIDQLIAQILFVRFRDRAMKRISCT